MIIRFYNFLLAIFVKHIPRPTSDYLSVRGAVAESIYRIGVERRGLILFLIPLLLIVLWLMNQSVERKRKMTNLASWACRKLNEGRNRVGWVLVLLKCFDVIIECLLYVNVKRKQQTIINLVKVHKNLGKMPFVLMHFGWWWFRILHL